MVDTVKLKSRAVVDKHAVQCICWDEHLVYNGCSTERRLRPWALKPDSLGSNSILLLNEACCLSFLSLIFFTCKMEMIIIATISQGYCEGHCWDTILKGLSHFYVSYEHRSGLCFVPGCLFKNICVAKTEIMSSPQQKTGRDAIIYKRIGFCRLGFLTCKRIHYIGRYHLALLVLLLGIGAQGTGTKSTESLATAISRSCQDFISNPGI